MSLPKQGVPLVDPCIACQAQMCGSSQCLLRHTMVHPQASLRPPCQRRKTSPPLPPSLLGLHNRSGYVICGTQCKWKHRDPCSKSMKNFQGVVAGHWTRHRALWDYMSHSRTKPALFPCLQEANSTFGLGQSHQSSPFYSLSLWEEE